MDKLAKAAGLTALIWAALSVDFVVALTEEQHVLFHIVVGALLTAYVILRYTTPRGYTATGKKKVK